MKMNPVYIYACMYYVYACTCIFVIEKDWTLSYIVQYENESSVRICMYVLRICMYMYPV